MSHQPSTEVPRERSDAQGRTEDVRSAGDVLHTQQARASTSEEPKEDHMHREGEGAQSPDVPKKAARPSADRPDRGFRPLPLDFVILEKLPEKGMIGGIHWKGRRVRDLRDEIAAGLEGSAQLPGSAVASRLRSMKVAGFVADFPTVGQGQIWARTLEGTAFLNTKDEVLG